MIALVPNNYVITTRSQVYICIYGNGGVLVGQKRVYGHWFRQTKNNAYLTKEAKRATFGGKLFDFFKGTEDGPSASLLTWAKNTTREDVENGYICLPGGGSNTSETVYQTAHREMLEETGFDIEQLHMKPGAKMYAKRFLSEENSYYYALYIYFDFSTIEETDPLYSLSDFNNSNGIINKNFAADDAFRKNLVQYYNASTDEFPDVKPPTIESDELSAVGAVTFEYLERNNIFSRFGQAWFKNVISSRKIF